MTKKDKQPRDETGKFASSKPITLYDKNGNVAYFTKEELDGFKNPDCEPATKGYVKCLMRKIHTHYHGQNISCVFTLSGAACGWFITLMACFGFGTSATASPFGFYPPVGYGLILSIVLTLVGLDLCYSNNACVSTEEDIPSVIKKYTPPTCEKKDECE